MPTVVRKIGQIIETFDAVFDDVLGSGNGVAGANVTVSFELVKQDDYVTATWTTASLEAGTTSSAFFRTTLSPVPADYRPTVDVYAPTSTRLGASTQKLGAILIRPSGRLRIYNDIDLNTVWTTSNPNHVVRSGSITYKVS